MCETIFKVSYMYFFGIFAFPTPDKHPYFWDRWDDHPPYDDNHFWIRYAVFFPGLNSRAELVTLAPCLCQERRFAPLAWGLYGKDESCNLIGQFEVRILP